MPGIDLNADLGEGFGVWRLGDDEAMLGIVTSANVACGFHAGDPVGLLRVCRSAAERGVRIGAQVSYRDLAGFGRRYIDVDADELVADVVYQIGALRAIAEASGSTVGYVKPHGALYNTIVADREQAAAVAEAVRMVDPGRVVTMVTSGRVTAIDGTPVPVTVESVCVHGDSPDAVQIATAVRDRLAAAGADIRAFC